MIITVIFTNYHFIKKNETKLNVHRKKTFAHSQTSKNEGRDKKNFYHILFNVIYNKQTTNKQNKIKNINEINLMRRYLMI